MCVLLSQIVYRRRSYLKIQNEIKSRVPLIISHMLAIGEKCESNNSKHFTRKTKFVIVLIFSAWEKKKFRPPTISYQFCCTIPKNLLSFDFPSYFIQAVAFFFHLEWKRKNPNGFTIFSNFPYALKSFVCTFPIAKINRWNNFFFCFYLHSLWGKIR